MASGPSIPQALVESLRSRIRTRDGASTLELAVRAAVESDREQHAWMLLALATRLRSEGHQELAKVAVDGAVALDAGPEATRAAHTCALALHADRGELQAAVELGEKLLAEGHDAYLLKAMARVYWELWSQTKNEDWHDRWWRVNVLRQAAATQAG